MKNYSPVGANQLRQNIGFLTNQIGFLLVLFLLINDRLYGRIDILVFHALWKTNIADGEKILWQINMN